MTADAGPLTTEERVALIERSTAELLTRDELARQLEGGLPLRHYIGFEISGRVHLGTGLVCMGKVRDFQQAGVHCSILLADWHTWINDKLGGDRDVIRRVAQGYFLEALLASITCVGGDPDAVEFVLGTELYAGSDDYWATVIEVSKHTSLARMQRSITILGRKEGESVDFAKLIYPAMQAADVFYQGITLAHAGMDQRKAHVIVRDCALQMQHHALHGHDGRVIKPVAVHHPLILGLGKPTRVASTDEERRDMLSEMKMSKSNPASAVFITDAPDVIRRKIQKAYCPPDDAVVNPVIDWIEKLVFGVQGGPFTVTQRDGSTVTFGAPSEVSEAFLSGGLHPGDAKNGLADWLIDTLEPARRHFEEPTRRAMLDEVEALLEPKGRGH